ncbi:MAG: penicillin-binding protein, partial [Beijerinckiaceae bacterium]|nr:penicillin-binding protein [Beijerinckiaceae bacterium]
TSQDWRDAWFIGYTGHLVTGVWLGNDDNSPTKKASGGNLPVAIWSRFMQAAHQNVPPQPLFGGWRREEFPPEEELPAAGGNMTSQSSTDWRAAAKEALGIAPPPAPRAGVPVPPADIPNPRAAPPSRASRPNQPNFFDALFGG